MALEFTEQPLIQEGPTSVGSVVSSFREFAAGAGENVAKLNQEGFFIGASSFGSAPFRVDYLGNMVATSATFPGQLSVFKQTSIPTALHVGDLWYDTDDGNKVYRAAAIGADQITAGEWELVTDTNKLDALGGAYNSAASGARVRIMSDANTGLLIVDDAGAEVFKALVGGTDVGDVIIGNYAGNKGLKWDKSAATFTVRGTLNADDITAGTLTGRTVKAKGTGVSSDVWLDGSVGEVGFYYGGTLIAELYCDTSGRVLLTTGQSIYLNASGSSDLYGFAGLVTWVSNSDLTCVFNDNGGTDSARWINDTSLTMEHRDNGDLAISGVYL